MSPTDDQIKGLDPEMAATWIVGSGAPLSKAQHQALVIACRNGGHVEAGATAHRGRLEHVSAAALRALVRRGYLTHGADGSDAVRLSERSRARLVAAIPKEQSPQLKDLPSNTELKELLARIIPHLASNDIATRAKALLDALAPATSPAAESSSIPDDKARALFGCTARAIDEALDGKDPRDIARYAMGALSNAQELIQYSECDGHVEWSVPNANRANTIRQLMNVAKYAIDKAVPR